MKTKIIEFLKEFGKLFLSVFVDTLKKIFGGNNNGTKI